MFRVAPALLVLASALSLASPNGFAQALPSDADAVRVNVTLNPDGSRTVYQFDQPQHKAIATTTGADGKTVGKIVYQIDDSGRFASGMIYGPDQKFLYKSTYKYGTSGRLEEETHLRKDDTVINKLVYSYDAAGKQTGYAIVDPNGKVIGRTSTAPATPSPTSKPRKKK